MKTLRRWLLLLTPLLLLAALGLWLTTPAALRLLIDTGGRLLPGTLQVGAVQGTLAGPIELHNLDYRNATTHWHSERISLDWKPWALLDGRLHVTLLRIDTPTITRLETTADTPSQLPALRLPVIVTVDALQIHNFKYVTAGGREIPVERIHLSAALEDARLDISHLEMASPLFTLRTSGDIDTRDYDLKLRTDWTLNRAAWPALAGHGTLRGDMEELRLEQQLTRPVTLDLRGTLFAVLGDVHWQATTQFQDLDTALLDARLPAHPVSGELNLNGDRKRFTLSGDIATRLETSIAAPIAAPSAAPIAAPVDVHVDGQNAAQAETRLPALGHLSLGGEVGGSYRGPWTIHRLDVDLGDHDIQLSTQGELRLDAGQPQSISHYNLTGQWRNLHWPLQATPAWHSERGSFRISGSISGSGHDYQTSVEASVAVIGKSQAGAMRRLAGTLALTTQGNDNSLVFDALTLDTPQGRIEATGNLGWPAGAAPQPEQLSYALTGRWLNLAWPTVADAPLFSPAGRFALQGQGQHYTASLNGDLAAPDRTNTDTDAAAATDTSTNITRLNAQGIRAAAQRVLRRLPVTAFSLQGKGDARSFSADQLKIALDQGSLQGSASVQWRPGWQWQLSLQGSKLGIATHWPQWPGSFAVNLTTRGRYADQRLDLELDLQRLEGRLRDFPLRASARVRLEGESVQIDALDWRSGDAALQVFGKVDSAWNVVWSVNAGNLNALWRDLQGQANASGKISGERARPRLEAKLGAARFGFREFSVAELQGLIDIDLADHTPSAVDINLRHLAYRQHTLDSLIINSQGRVSDQRWKLLLGQGGNSLRAEVDGGYADQVWQGRVTDLIMQLERAGTWQLQTPVALRVAAREARSELLCLTSTRGEICGRGAWQSERGATLETRFNNMAVAMLGWVLPPEVQWQDQFSGELRAEIQPDRRMTLTGGLAMGPGRFTYRDPDAQAIAVDYQRAALTASTTADGTRLALDIALGSADSQTNDKLTAELRLPGFNRLERPPGDQPLQGRISGNYRQLDVISLFVPNLQRVKGELSAELRIAGSIDQPTLNGAVTLTKAELSIISLGVQLRNLQLALHSNGSDTLTVQGQAQSGKGTVRLSGQWRLQPEQGWPAELKLDGSNFDVVSLPTLALSVSPQLNITTRGRHLDITGSVAIPRGDIVLRSFATTVATSSDAVIIQRQAPGPASGPASGQGTAPESARQGWTVNTLIRVLPGERVLFQGFGLTGNVSGDVLIVKPADKPMLGTGRLEISKGQYQTFGLDLDITQGQLIFANSPIDNPALDFRAQRSIATAEGQIIAGAQVQGRLKDAVIRLFSEPPLAETDILSYILTGRPASAATEGDENLLLAAAAAIGTSEAFLATKRLAKSIGFEDVRIHRSGVVMGKALSERLYLSYEIGLIEPQNTLQLRYTLSEHWSVKVESNESQSTDLLFSIER